MANIQKTNDGIVIDNKIIISADGKKEGYINLLTHRGNDMIYGNPETIAIDYPGEYDYQGIFFRVYEGKEGKLNATIKYDETNIGYVQSPEILEQKEFDGVKTWIFSGESVAKVLDKLEWEGERIDTDTLTS